MKSVIVSGSPLGFSMDTLEDNLAFSVLKRLQRNILFYLICILPGCIDPVAY